MTKHLLAGCVAAAFAVASAAPVAAQTEHQTKVKTDTSVDDGVATTRRTVTSTTKRKTGQPRKVLGVKVGEKTATTRTVRQTTVSSNGDHSSTVKTSH